VRSPHICCDVCNGEGIIESDLQDAATYPGEKLYTVCEECNGLGWFTYLKSLLILIIPSFLIFGGGA
jgi:DnaJ-class molecular chaperone